MVSGNGDGKPRVKYGVSGSEVIYIFEPKNDISSQEAAAMLPFFSQGILAGVSTKLYAITGRAHSIIGTPDSVDLLWESLPKGVRRHFRAVTRTSVSP